MARRPRGHLALILQPRDPAGGPFNEQGDPAISADGLELFHSSSMGDLHVSTRTVVTDDFGTPVPLPAPVASTQWQEGPAQWSDGHALYFSEVNAGGMFELHVATRVDRCLHLACPRSSPTCCRSGIPSSPSMAR